MDGASPFSQDCLNIGYIRGHRMAVGFFRRGLGTAGTPQTSPSTHQDPPPSQPGPAFTTFKTEVPPGLRPILLEEMKEEKVYQGRVLFLTLSEDLVKGVHPERVTLLGKDEKSQVMGVRISGITLNEELGGLLSYGTNIAIINPCHGIYQFQDERGNRVGPRMSELVVTDPTQLLRLGKKEKMCRYCGKENAPRKCTTCKVPYCSRECQSEDWKILMHRVICKR